MRKYLIRYNIRKKEAIRKAISRSKESRYCHRLHGILMICNGMSCSEVAKVLGRSPRTVQHWVRKFEDMGFGGLLDGKRKGRPRSINESQMKKIRRDLLRKPTDVGYMEKRWTGKIISLHLSEEYSISLGIRQCQRLKQQIARK